MAEIQEEVRELTEAEIRQLARKKAKKKAQRAERMAEEGLPLNINSMMDMMTIILVFLLKSYSSEPIVISESDDLRVPYSSTELAPEDMVVITITKSTILVEDRSIGVRLTNGEVDVGQLQSVDSPIITALQSEIESELEQAQRLLDRHGIGSGERLVTIIADADTPYKTLTQVMMTASVAGVQNFKFAAIQRPQGSGLQE